MNAQQRGRFIRFILSSAYTIKLEINAVEGLFHSKKVSVVV